MSTTASPFSLRCPICGSLEIVRNSDGDYVCSNCGFVVLEAREVDFDAFEGYGADNKPVSSRGALTNTLHDKGLGSVFDARDAKGRRRYLFRQLSNINDRMKFGNKKESFLGDVKKGIDQFSSMIANTLGAPIPKPILDSAYSVADVVYDILPEKYRKSSIEFRRLVGLAIILAVVKEYGTYLPPEIVINNLNLDTKTKKEVKTLYALIHDAIKKKKLVKASISPDAKFKEVANIILNYLKAKAGLVLERETLVLETAEKIWKVLKKADRDVIGSRYMSSTIGGILYVAKRVLAINQRSTLSQESMAKALGRGANAMRNAYIKVLDTTLIVVEVPAYKPSKNKNKKKKASKG